LYNYTAFYLKNIQIHVLYNEQFLKAVEQFMTQIVACMTRKKIIF